MDSQTKLRIVLLGHTGAGKSSTGNTILGRKQFKGHTGGTSKTRQCEPAKCIVDGRKIEVMDTPGYFDTHRGDIQSEIIKCLEFKPHIFLIVISLRNRFPEEAEQTLKSIEDMFGPGLYRHSIVVFAGKDYLSEQAFDEFLEDDLAPAVRDLLEKCKKRCVAFNNNEPNKSDQVQELLDVISKMDQPLPEFRVATTWRANISGVLSWIINYNPKNNNVDNKEPPEEPIKSDNDGQKKTEDPPNSNPNSPPDKKNDTNAFPFFWISVLLWFALICFCSFVFITSNIYPSENVPNTNTDLVVIRLEVQISMANLNEFQRETNFSVNKHDLYLLLNNLNNCFQKNN